MITQTERDRLLFIHKTFNKLEIANACHVKSEKIGFLDSDCKEDIEGAKFDFRIYLRPYALGWQPIPILPEGYTLDKIKEAYNKSNFDWSIRDEYMIFQNWFCATP